ncbi:hypothetical protein E6O75_ATG07683 [Venturia nashicola]|uniref:Uncharacterized protein n=1 Tax=Venturia nashicola TaxID=86259 RepID=A0A4Z1P214_9PEZI|nr:hypothetical protein E6O75_ATG07683 [Venturia nashicola]
MANITGAPGKSAIPNLTREEERLFDILFKQADTKGDGIVTGEVAITLFFKTKLSENILGEIWAMADTENRGFLLKDEFSKAMRLIGHFQSRPGRPISLDLALQPCPPGFPKFEGVNMPPGQSFDESQAAALPPPPAFPSSPMQAQNSGVRVPPLTPDRVADYTRLFESGGVPKGGTLDGDKARDFFQRSGLPNNILAHVWNLADTEQRSALSLAEFIIAMHLLASYRIGALTALPQTLPAGLIEAASRRAAAPPVASAMPRQFSGAGGRTASPLARQAFGTPPVAPPSDWLVGPIEKNGFDQLFDKLDTHKNGYISGDQAVSFFSESGLPQDSLAAIWDLSTIRGLDQLNRDEFAVAMYLIRDQRGKATPDLPSVIPPNLIPPSMRGIPKPGMQPQATGFPTPAAPAPAAKPPSAAEDLFGLDALSNPPAVAPLQQSQATGGSASGVRSFDDSFNNKTSSPTSQTFGTSSPHGTSRGVSSSHFKPFIPSSSFGQGLATNTTGGSGTSSNVQSRDMKPSPPSAMDDLLGDNDPEISKKLTNETAELANMSSQIGTLRNQMQEVQQKKGVTQNELNTTNSQRRDLELRLSQFRTQFEQEASAVKALEEQLTKSRSETRRLQQDYALLEANYHDLQNQHQQAGGALENERRENANLKERMRQINAEMAQLRPQLEKMKNDSRHEKGMVSINKKQLEKSETERDIIKNEINELSRSQIDGSRGLSQSNVASPAPSTASQSTNPFFRKSPHPSIDNTMSPGGFARPDSKDSNVNAGAGKFDNIWGPAARTGSPATQPSYGQSAFPPPSDRSISDVGMPTPSASPRPADLPPLPVSRQITSSDLPFAAGRNETAASSVRVETPVSRYAGNETPTNATSSSPSAFDRPEPMRTDTNQSTGASLFDRNANASPVASVTSQQSRGPQQENKPEFFKSFSRDIPGAFPDPTPLPKENDGDSLYGHPNRTATTKSDFDSAFASVGAGKPPAARQMTSSSTNGSLGDPSMNKFHSEFPPIAVKEPESDSESEAGFDDDFTQASPAHQRKISENDFDDRSRPALGGKESGNFFSSQPAAEPPRPEAQQSPPSYNTSTSPSEPRGFPSEFGGLLPTRENPIASPSQAPAQSPPAAFVTPAPGGQGHALFGGSSTSKSGSVAPTSTFSVSPPPTSITPASSTVPSDAYHSAPSHPSGSGTEKGSSSGNHSQKPSFNDDFGADFDDLAEAKEDDDDQGDDDYMFTSQHHEGFEEFNPAFDSPAMSKSGTMASERTPKVGTSGFGDDSFGDFETNFNSLQASTSSKKAPQDDWDAMMKSISSEPPNAASSLGKGFEENASFGTGLPDLAPPAPTPPVFGPSEPPRMSGSGRFAPPEVPEPPKPSLGRTMTESSVHDDPSVQRLVSMGYSRSTVVRTLEKYDYDFGKALDDLTSN